MNRKEIELKKKEFAYLYMSGLYSQKEIAEKINIHKVTINRWYKDLPVIKYDRIKENLIAELERLSANPQGNEDLIFRYIEKIDMLEKMIKRAIIKPE